MVSIGKGCFIVTESQNVGVFDQILNLSSLYMEFFIGPMVNMPKLSIHAVPLDAKGMCHPSEQYDLCIQYELFVGYLCINPSYP